MKPLRSAAMTATMSCMLAACNGTTAPNTTGNLTVNFVVESSTPAPGTALYSANYAAAALDLSGDNGSLTIDEIWLVADEFKLERVTDACADGVAFDDNENCVKFELPPFFVPVPLEGEGTGEVGAEVPPGTYGRLKFETKAPNDDDDDASLLTEIRTQFDDWPSMASLLVTGMFTSADGGEPAAFRVYFDAEVKVELAFDDAEPLVIEEGGDQVATVFIDPGIWFANDDGTVDDLTVLDYDATSEVFKFEAKFENAFTKIELN